MGARAEDLRRGQEMEEEEARRPGHCLPGPVLQARLAFPSP